MRKLKFIDTHVHVDKWHDPCSKGKKHIHGEYPVHVARAILEKRLDGCLILAHKRAPKEYFDVCAELEKFSKETRNKLLMILGAEFNLFHQGNRFHFGYLYESEFSRTQMPPAFQGGVKQLQQYRKEFPGATILFHPGIILKKSSGYREDMITDLCKSGLIDGVEVLTGIPIIRSGFLKKSKREYRLAKKVANSTAICGGSDAHSRNFIGSCATGFVGESVDDFFFALRSRQTKAVGLSPRKLIKAVNESIREYGYLGDFVQSGR